MAQADTEHVSSQQTGSSQAATGDRKELRGGEQASARLGRRQRGKGWAPWRAAVCPSLQSVSWHVGRFKGERAPGPAAQTSPSGKRSETQGDRGPEGAPPQAGGEERPGLSERTSEAWHEGGKPCEPTREESGHSPGALGSHGSLRSRVTVQLWVLEEPLWLR